MRQLNWLLSHLSGLLVLALVLLTAAAVFARYVLGAPITYTEELSGLFMIWIIFLGAVCCEIDDEHLTIDMVVNTLPTPLRFAITVAVGLASIGLLLLMAWLSWELAHSAGLKRTQILRISWFWINLAVVVGAAGMALAMAVRLWKILRTGRLPERTPPSPHDIV